MTGRDGHEGSEAGARRVWAWLFVLLTVLPGCEDPEREARLRWREEEVNAKETALVRKEREMLKEREEMAAERLTMAARESELTKLKAEMEAELEKMKQARRAFEIKNLRGQPPRITAERVIVIDPATGEVLFEKNADKRGAIASTQKLLTAILVAERGNLDAIVTVQKSDSDCAPVRLGIKEGEQYSRRQLLTALMVKSSNDIAQALARDHSGSVEAFVAAMNAKAKELGLEDSLFRNPHGLPSDPEQYSTARNLAKIASVADLFPDIRQMVKTKRYVFERAGQTSLTLDNTNRVLQNYPVCDGMKTGFTNAAGYCLVASGEKNGKRRIVVVLNGGKSGVWADAQALLEWAVKA
jgi:serine-type D-Ala-D-Ala carboxypeptidase (penicillin-binding protein 5/6)